MNRTGRPEDKWARPGWRPEQRYSNKVLLGNWAEERLQFTREPQTAILDRRACWDAQPDASERRPAPLRAEGLPYKLLFAHHGPPSSRYLVSHYEESYRRIPWHPSSSARRLGRSERPISAALPTGSGRLPCTRRSEAPPSLRPSLSVYGSEYRRHPVSGLCHTRFATAPRALSSHLHAANHHKNKDLELRGRPLLQVPDRCWSPPPRAQWAQRQQRGS